MDPNSQACPWSDWQPAVLTFCENHLCAWVSSPTETYSNINYIIIGFYLCWQAYKKKQSIFLYTFGISAWVLGIFSGIYHASHTLVFELLDQSTMLMLSTSVMIGAMVRLDWIKKNFIGTSYLALLALSVFTLCALPGQFRVYVFSSMVLAAFIFEALLLKRDRVAEEKVDFFYVKLTMIIFLTSYGFWLLDIHRIACDPDNHYVSGHALWHLINSFCFWTLYRHYEQFSIFEHPPTTE